jgi:hypothetical protein
MMIFDLHLQLFIVAINEIAADAADDFFLVEGRRFGHGRTSQAEKAILLSDCVRFVSRFPSGRRFPVDASDEGPACLWCPARGDAEQPLLRLKLLQEELAAAVGERINRSLFILPLVTVLALPVNMIAGLLGMNVGGIPLAQHGQGFLIVISCLAVVTGVLAYFFLLKRRDLHPWSSRSRHKTEDPSHYDVLNR